MENCKNSGATRVIIRPCHMGSHGCSFGRVSGSHFDVCFLYISSCPDGRTPRLGVHEFGPRRRFRFRLESGTSICVCGKIARIMESCLAPRAWRPERERQRQPSRTSRALKPLSLAPSVGFQIMVRSGCVCLPNVSCSALCHAIPGGGTVLFCWLLRGPPGS